MNLNLDIFLFVKYITLDRAARCLCKDCELYKLQCIHILKYSNNKNLCLCNHDLFMINVKSKSNLLKTRTCLILFG